jgi:glycosyltransferase involved in cell wall biosynthesis
MPSSNYLEVQTHNIINSKPMVSVIISSYEKGKWLLEAVDSVFQQTYRPIELIVVDDASGDGSIEELMAIKGQYSHDEGFAMHIHRRSIRRGHGAAINLGLRNSKGRYIQILDADDLIGRKKIQYQVEQLLSEASDVISYGPWRLFTEHDREYFIWEANLENKENDKYIDWIRGWWVPPHSLLWSREAMMANGPWDESLRNDTDGEFVLRYLSRGGQMKYCPKAWCYYRRAVDKTKVKNVSLIVTGVGLRSRIRVLRRQENHLFENKSMTEEYRNAVAQRYYLIGAWAGNNSLIRELCYRNYNKYATAKGIPSQLSRAIRLFIRLFGYRYYYYVYRYLEPLLVRHRLRHAKKVKMISYILEFDETER